MSIYLSTGLRDNLIGDSPAITAIVSETLTFTNSTSQITKAGGTAFGTIGFLIGDLIYSDASNGNNPGPLTVTTVADNALTVSETLTDEGPGATALAASHSGNFQDVMRYGILDIYSGSRPASGDAAETGTLLCSITDGGGSFSGGTITNGLLFGDPSSGVVAIKSTQTWQGTAVATGTAAWFRFYANAYNTGVSTTAVRFDGTIGTSGSGADLIMSSTSIVSAGVVSISSFTMTQPSGV